MTTISFSSLTAVRLATMSARAMPRRSTRSQSREVESAASSVEGDEGASMASTSSALPQTGESYTARRRRKSTKKAGRNGTVDLDAVIAEGEETEGEAMDAEGDDAAIAQGLPKEQDTTSSPKRETPKAQSSGKQTPTPQKARTTSIQQTDTTEVRAAERSTPHVNLLRDTTQTITSQPSGKGRRRLRALLARAASLIPRLPPLLIVASILLALALPTPQKPFQRNVYVDENALQPGAASVGWSWADVDHADGVANRIAQVASESSEKRAEFLSAELQSHGYAAHKQAYHFSLPSSHGQVQALQGVNTYARWPSARGDGREAFVISASWKSSWDGSDDPDIALNASRHVEAGTDGALSAYDQTQVRRTNVRGIATALAMARYLVGSRQWSKDLIFVFADGEMDGMQAWTSAYFGREQANLRSDPLHGRGALVWNALALDYPSDSFSHIEIRHEGLDGQLPNLDMISTLDHLMHRAHNVPLTIPTSSDEKVGERPLGAFGDLLEIYIWSQGGAARKYVNNLRKITRQVMLGAAGHPSGSHGLFHRYHVDAVTVFARPAKGPYGFYNMGRMVESLTRSMSNLLERLHHSHFFYILTSPEHFVEVAKYLPVAILFCTALMIAGIVIWVQEGDAAQGRQEQLVEIIGNSIHEEEAEDEASDLHFNGGPRLESNRDVPLRNPTVAQRTQSLIFVLVQRSARRGDLVGSKKIRLLASLLQSQSRPLSGALTISVLCHVIGIVVLQRFRNTPVDCARNGLFQCKPLRLTTLLLVFGMLTTAFAAQRRSKRRVLARLAAVQTLLPEDALGALLITRHTDRRALARTTLALAMLEASTLTLIVSIVNFGLAAVLGIVLSGALCSVRLPRSWQSSKRSTESSTAAVRESTPASDDSDAVDALLPGTSAVEEGAGFVPLRWPARIRLVAHGVVLLSITPPPVLYISKAFINVLTLYVDTTQQLGPSLLRRADMATLVERLVDGAAWDYQILSSILIPLVCTTYVPIVLTGAVACFLMAGSGP